MSGFVRRLVIFATIEGLVLQAHGHPENHKSLLIDYKTHKVVDSAKSTPPHNQDVVRLDAHGLIGLLTIANLSYLIAITKREEVGRIFDKPIYRVADVVLLPLASFREASDAIRNMADATGQASDDSDSSISDSEDTDVKRNKVTDIASTPGDDNRPFQGQNSSSTSVAEDVARGNVSFGRFATQWLSRQRWPTAKAKAPPFNAEESEPDPVSKDDKVVKNLEAAKAQKEAADKPQAQQASTTLALLPRMLRTTKFLFCSGSYFFSYDIDLTRRFGNRDPIDQPLELRNIDSKYFWNKGLGTKFLETSNSDFLTPVIQGFVGQRTFKLSKNPISQDDAKASDVVKQPPDVKPPSETDSNEQSLLLTLISRRSVKRSGLRYLRRGIDDEGNVANFVETEQILSSTDWSSKMPIRSFVQVRGSIPLYFSQSPYSFKPVVVFHNSPQANEKAFEKHFADLEHQYGATQIALLVDKHATEKPIGDAYQNMYEKLRDSGRADDIFFEWFDFHHECRGMKFENVSRLIEKVDPFLISSSETIIQDGKVAARQKGVIRTNCMDCLDRTNVAQSAFAQHMLQKALKHEGYSIDFVTDPSTNWFNTLWADNGDAISRQYAGTAALKGDYTRTRKRDWRGAVNDFGLTLSRYYSNMVNDYFSQAVIDVLLGNVSWKVFEDFELTMMSADPGISVQSGREAAIDTCSKIVIQDPEKEDLIHAWTMLIPNQENTLRTLPFEEAVVLLTDAALYCCKMDWSTEKIARYEKVDLRSVKAIKWGVYVTSTFTDRQMREDINQGLVIYYTPGKGDIVRVNTRSLQNYQVPDEDRRQGLDGGTGILSWVASSVSKPSAQDRIMALKVMLPDDDDVGISKAGSPGQIAETISDEIRRAIVGGTENGEQRGQQMVEHGDIISVVEARKRTGYLEQVSHSLKRLVWA